MRPAIAGIVLAGALGLSACDRLFVKDTKASMESAEKKVAAGDFRGAIRIYETALDATPMSAEIHYRLALLYDDKLKSPLNALHHFGRYLELEPAGKYSREAKAYRKEGEFKLVSTFFKGNFINQEEAVRLKNDNQELRKVAAELRAQKNVVLPAGVAKGEQVRKPVPQGARLHTVVSGETLASIAAKYYKNKANWKRIQDANFYPLSGTARINRGDQLVIP